MIPYNLSNFSTSFIEKEIFVQSSLISWEINLNIIETGENSDIVYFGEKTDASDGQDSYDVPKVGSPPPPPFIYAYSATSLATPYHRLWKDYRQHPDTYKQWNITIEWQPDGPEAGTDMTINWDNETLKTIEYVIINRGDHIAVNTLFRWDLRIVCRHDKINPLCIRQPCDSFSWVSRIKPRRIKRDINHYPVVFRDTNGS